MANTFTQLHVQLIFAVQNRISLIHDAWKDELYKYFTGIIQSNNHKMLIGNGMPDHVHLFIGMRPTQSIAELMWELKQSSSKWINQRGFVRGKFQWQDGYGAFSYTKKEIPIVCNYIQYQQEHHRKVSFSEEYRKLLDEFEVEYDERYIFKDFL